MNGVLARFTKKNSREITTAVALVLVILIFSLLNSRYMEYDNLIDIIQQGTVNGFLAMGITVAIITAGIDLSVGSTMAVDTCSLCHAFSQQFLIRY